MALNDFAGTSPDNYEQKCLCVLLLDVSGSMSGMPIDELNKGLQEFYDETIADSVTADRLEISIITFDSTVNTILEPSLLSDFTMPTLKTKGSTAMIDGIQAAIDKVEARKSWYKSTGQTYYRPWIVMMTDGEPDRGQDIDGMSIRIKQDVKDKKYVFFPIGVGSSNMNVLDKLSAPPFQPAKLQGLKFSQFFQWLSNSMQLISKSSDGQSVNLNQGVTNWMDSYQI